MTDLQSNFARRLGSRTPEGQRAENQRAEAPDLSARLSVPVFEAMRLRKSLGVGGCAAYMIESWLMREMSERGKHDADNQG